jgi:hypothetical protein
MSTPQRWRQLTLFDDLEVPIPLSVESPLPSATNLDQADGVPAIDVSRVRRKMPERGRELEGPR